jgi:aspartate-semialdehyde dehydrogenase
MCVVLALAAALGAVTTARGAPSRSVSTVAAATSADQMAERLRDTQDKLAEAERAQDKAEIENNLLILLRHKRAGGWRFDRAQQGHRSKLRASAAVRRRRIVAIEF